MWPFKKKNLGIVDTYEYKRKMIKNFMKIKIKYSYNL
jgi:hypothetical protein